ncbi:MAG: DNA repair protein RecO [Candidatus Eisenbacteria bacterium]|nr:DNA repair protein RecO [Candidatus Eisenbacteria bacterium]
MPIERDEAIVLGRTRLGDSSLIVSLFTRRRGPVRVVAKAARRARSRFGGVLEPTNHVLAVYYRKESRDLQTLSQCDLVTAFSALRESLLRLAYAYAIIDGLAGLKREETPAEALFALALEAFARAENGPKEELEDMLWRFLLAALADAGFRPELERCLRCGKPAGPGPVLFDARAGGVVCGSHGEGGLILSPGTLERFRTLSRGGRPPAPTAPRETGEGREALRRFLREHGLGRDPFRALGLLTPGS